MHLRTSLTFRQQEVGRAEMPLTRGHHQQRPALFVAYIHIRPVLQQQICDLKERCSCIKHLFWRCLSCWGVLQRRTCQCPCRTAQNRAHAPLLFTCWTCAPRSSRKLHTSIFPRPAAAVRAERMKTNANSHSEFSLNVTCYYNWILNSATYNAC